MVNQPKDAAGRNSVDSSKMFGRTFDEVIPTPTRFDCVPVKISASTAVFQQFAEAFIDSIRDRLTLCGNGSMPVSEQEVKAYLEYAVYARVQQVTGGPSKWKRHDTFRIPSFLQLFLAQIGKVDKPGIGISLIPVWEGDEPQLDGITMSRVSNLLSILEQHGFEMNAGLPRNNEGDWGVMSMELAESRVLNTTNEHPQSAAVIAGFFGVQGLASVLGANAYRVQYVTLGQVACHAFEVVNGNARRS